MLNKTHYTLMKIKADINTVTWNSMYILVNANTDKGEFEFSQELLNRYYSIFNEFVELQDELKAMYLEHNQ